MSQNTELLDFVLSGRKDFFRLASIYSPLPGAAFQESSQTMVYCSGVDYAPCNGIINKDKDYVPNGEEIQEAIKFFEERKVPFIWWSYAKVLENYHFQYGGILTGIALDMSNKELQSPTSPSGLTIELIQSEEKIRTFSNVAVNAFGMPSHTSDQFAKANIAVVEAKEQIHFLASFNDIPVGTVTLSSNENSAGIWNLATLPEYRKSGIGKALVATALIEAKNQGHGTAMAILMPKGMAWGIFESLGFEEVCQFPFYVYGASSASLED